MRLGDGNPMGRVLMTCLVLQALTFALALPVMIVVSGVPAGLASGLVGGAVVLAIAAAAGLRRGWGYALGWATQVVGIALGTLTSGMYVMGAIFAGLWLTSFLLGRRLDAR